jgi:DNA-3-methyladenine glycosylase II
MTLVQVEGTLQPVPPFDFNQSLRFMSHFQPAMGQQTAEAGVLTKALTLDGQTFVFRATSTGTTDAPRLAYTLYSETAVIAETQAAAADHIAFFLSLNDDLRPFYAIGEDDPFFAPVIRELYGYHQVKFPSPFENAVWAILSQRNLMGAARHSKDWLTERFGGSLGVEGVVYRAFPEPARLALLTVDELNAAIGNIRKAECVASAARAFDQVDGRWLREADADDVGRWLRGIKGIGAWSAAFVLLRGLGRMEHIPPNEKWLLLAASKRYGRTLSQQDLEALARPYGAYRGYWAHYLRAAD